MSLAGWGLTSSVLRCSIMPCSAAEFCSMDSSTIAWERRSEADSLPYKSRITADVADWRRKQRAQRIHCVSIAATRPRCGGKCGGETEAAAAYLAR